MKHVKVLGTGCSSCKTTIRLIQQVADERGVAIQLEKVESLPESKRAARTVLTGMCYSVGSATRQGSSSPTRFIGQSAMTSRT
nr:thioredoxin family protein [Klebsiella variicola]